MTGFEASMQFSSDMAAYDAKRKLPSVEAENSSLRRENAQLRQENEHLHQQLEQTLKEKGIGQKVSVTG